MKNISRNGMQAVVVTKDSYLGHSKLPGFSLESGAFTVEVRFACANSYGGVLYAQEDGLAIGFSDNIPYAAHPAIGRLYGTQNRKLSNNGLMMVSATFDGSKFALQLNGIEVVSKNASVSGPPVSGDFSIGKDFNGYIEGVRIVKSAMTDIELVRDYGSGFQDRADIAFQTDFTTKQYKDVGPDRVPLWRTGTVAHCANVVAAARLDQNGAYTRSDKVTFTNGFSVCGRFYPDFRSLTSQTFYALGNDRSIVRIGAEMADDGYFPCAHIGDTILKSDSEITGLSWHDIAVSVDMKNSRAALYLDGEKVASDKISIDKMENTVSVIGAEFFVSSPSYKNGFAGYLDYFAEFNKAVTEDEVTGFIEHEPYFYNDGIVSLLLFGWGEARDAMRGKHIAGYGSGRFTMAADTMPLDAPIGANWAIPSESDEAYWSTLTKNQRWALTLYTKLVAQVLDGTLGFAMEGENPSEISEEDEFEIVHRKYLDPMSQKVLRWALGDKAGAEMEDDDLTALLSEDTPLPERTQELYERTFPESWASSRQVTAMSGAGGAAAALTAVGGESTTGLGIKGIIVAGGSFIVKKIGDSISKLIDNSRKRRPPNPRARLVALSCSWNNSGKAESGTVYFHNDADSMTGPDSMEWLANDDGISMTAVFVPSLLQILTMKIRVRNNGGSAFHGTLSLIKGNAVSYSDEFALASGAETEVSIVHGDLASFQRSVIGTFSGTYELSCFEQDYAEFMVNIRYTYHTIAHKPVAPWQTGENGEYDRDNSGYIHTGLIEKVAASIGNSAEAAMDAKVIDGIINWMNHSHRLTYDVENGAPFYSTVSKRGFKRVKFLRDMSDGGTHKLNCTDCANIVSGISAAYGVDIPMTILSGADGYKCNEIQVITSGTPAWAVPFAQRARTGFGFHMMNRSSTGTQWNVDIMIYDACLKLDMGLYPGKPEAAGEVKIARQPQNLLAAATNEGSVNVPVNLPYAGAVYRERLVANGEIASFLAGGPIRLNEFDDTVTFISETENGTPAGWNVSKVRKIGEEYGEIEWQCEYQGKALEICRYPLNTQIKAVVESFTTRDWSEFTDEKTGLSGYRVGGSCMVVQKDNYIYRLTGETADAVLLSELC